MFIQGSEEGQEIVKRGQRKKKEGRKGRANIQSEAGGGNEKV